MTPASGPYHVERIEAPGGPRWRLSGPGLDGTTKTYPWDEVRDKLAQMAELMNFAWRQCEGRQKSGMTGDHTRMTNP